MYIARPYNEIVLEGLDTRHNQARSLTPQHNLCRVDVYDQELRAPHFLSHPVASGAVIFWQS